MTSEADDPLLIRADAAYRDVIADPGRGRKTAEAVAAAARSAGASEALIVALRAVSWAAREVYDHDAAGRHLTEAIRIARRAGLDERRCEALITRSAVYLELGRPGRARRDLEEADRVAGERSRPEVALARGTLEDAVGNFGAAVAAFRRAVIGLGDDRPELRVKALNNLALTELRFGRHRRAEELLAEAVALAETFSQAFAGFVTESQAFAAISGGQPVEALRRYERAEALLTSMGLHLADLYLGKARALLTLRLLDEAAEAAARAVKEVEGIEGGSLMLAEALLPQARIALAQQRHAEAAAAAGRAEQLFRRQRRAGWRAAAALVRLSAQAQTTPTTAMTTQLDRIERAMRVMGNMPGAVDAALLQGEVCAALGRTRKAVAAFGRAARAGAGGPALLRIQGRTAAARRAELVGDTRRLSLQCRLGLDELAAYRATVASAELRARAAGHGMTLADIGLRAALNAGRAEQIWAWLERARSVVYVRGAVRPDETLRPLLAELRASESQLDELSPDAAADRADLLTRIAGIERRIRSASWTRKGASQGWTAPSVRALRELRCGLGDRALLQYGAFDGRLCAVVVTRTRMRFATLGRVDEVVGSARQLGFALRRLNHPRSRAGVAAAFGSAREGLRHLAGALLDPIAPWFAGADEVVVAPPGELIGIPWGALAPLADRPVRVVPSALAWWQGRNQVASSARTVLVAGPGLPGAENEIHRVARRYRGAVELSRGSATVEAVQRAVTGARLVHIAGHGRLRSDSPTFSSLQLADGPLTVHDLEGLEAPAHHWVLAACDLGHPGAVEGPALEGVLASLLSGGAGAVVAAVVSVPDLSTRDLMVALHEGLAAGLPMPEALRRAKGTLDTGDPTAFVATTAFACYGGG
jgi:tetratricopeptide (TPR) repeat protein